MQSKLVAFFAPDFTEVSTITRARGFLEHGLTLVVFAFRRGRYNPAFKSPWREIDLGRTVDGRYLDRALKMFAALPIIWRNRVLLRQAVVFYARNLDQLMLASARGCWSAAKLGSITRSWTSRGPSRAQAFWLP